MKIIFKTKVVLSIAVVCFGLSLTASCSWAQKLETYNADSLKQGDNWYLYNSGAQFGRTKMSNVVSENTDGKSNPEILTTEDGRVARFKLHTYNSKRGKFNEYVFQGTELTKNSPLLSLPQNSDQSALFRARIKINNITAGAVFGFYAVEPEAGATGDEIDNEFLGTLKPTLWLNLHKDGNQFDPEDIKSNPFGSAKDWEKFNTYTMRWSRNSVTWHINDVGDKPPTIDTFSAVNNRPTKKAVGPLVPDTPLRVQLNAWVSTEEEFPQAYSAGLKPATSKTNNKTYFYDVKWVQIGRSGILTAKGKPKNVVP